MAEIWVRIRHVNKSFSNASFLGAQKATQKCMSTQRLQSAAGRLHLQARALCAPAGSPLCGRMPSWPAGTAVY